MSNDLQTNLEYFMMINYTGQQKKTFVKVLRMLNRFGVKSGALSLKMHLVLPN